MRGGEAFAEALAATGLSLTPRPGRFTSTATRLNALDLIARGSSRRKDGRTASGGAPAETPRLT